MKKSRMVIIAVLLIALICGLFYWTIWSKDHTSPEQGELTEVERIITKDLGLNYPATPREVVKLYNRILDCYYDEKYTSEQFDGLTSQALALFDEELRANNPKLTYQQAVTANVEEFHNAKKTMTQTAVCASNDVQYREDDGDELAFVEASYFVKENNSYTKTFQTYVLRKDDEGQWKILAFFQTYPDSNEEED